MENTNQNENLESGAPRNSIQTPCSVFVVFSSWDGMGPLNWDIKAVFATKEDAEKEVVAYPKTSEETGFEPMTYKIEEWEISSPNRRLNYA